MHHPIRRFAGAGLAVLAVLALTSIAAPARAADKKPNIVIIWGDDIGQSDISAYSMGLMGFKTPNIDRVAHEGMIFTDYYAEQSCTAGRASFLTGQSGLRTGLTKVGLPGATLGLQKEDPTIAELLKPLGYATGQFGKNHLGDRNEFLPTVHGFDEFYGNLYHLNAEEEPELPDYPKDAAFRTKFGPRGVMDCKASTTDDPTVDPRFGKVGKQVCTDTGPLTKKRMETIDDDVAKRAVDFIQRQNQAGKPAFVWVNFSHMHFRTHTKPESIGQAGRWQSPYHDTMIDHDKNVGQVLKVLDDLGIADNTFVMYSTDNGPHMNSWPDSAMTPFRSEKNSNWEGAYRVPAMVRWPGKIKPGSVSNEIVAHHDWLPTLLAMAGDSQVTDKLLKGYKVGAMSYKVHLDGYNLVPYLTGQEQKSPRESFLYVNDDQQLTGLRYDNWKFVFMEQRARGTMRIWSEPFVSLRIPKLFNLRTDPYERADITSNTYYDWVLDHAFTFVPAQDFVGKFLMTFKEYPQRQKAASFNLDEVLRSLKESSGSKSKTQRGCCMGSAPPLPRRRLVDSTASVARRVRSTLGRYQQVNEPGPTRISRRFRRPRAQDLLAAALVGALAFATTKAHAAEPLPSWNDGKAKQSIIDFVTKVTTAGSPDFVPVPERIATFDNDGTLWCEQPVPVQLYFALDRVKALAPQHPEWKTKEPFASLLKGDLKTALAGGEHALLELIMATHAGMTTVEFEQIVKDWIATAKHPKTGRLYTEMVYQPMLEVLAYLRANGFKNFIVSGGGIEFMRPWTEQVYGIPPEQVVGSSIKTKFEMRGGKPVLVRLPELNFNDDKADKPVGINRHIGRRPIAAFGNSRGDQEMLEYTQGGGGARFELLVLHDDAAREYAYGPALGLPDVKLGAFTQAVYDEARKAGWTVVSMKDDWKQVFPAPQSPVTAIDILLEPDATMLRHAEAVNASHLEVYPKGFPLDATHRPHITLIQRFVRTADLDQVYAAAGKVLARGNVTSMKLEAFKYYYLPTKDLGLSGIVARPTPELLKLQEDIIAAVAPFTVETGDSSAFFTTPDDPVIDPFLIQYVSTFVPKSTGEHFNPHVTTGLAPKAYLDKLLAEPFEKFTFSPAGAAVYQLGQFGTAAQKLKEWDLKP